MISEMAQMVSDRNSVALPAASTIALSVIVAWPLPKLLISVLNGRTGVALQTATADGGRDNFNVELPTQFGSGLH
jgi:hypothetical protein